MDDEVGARRGIFLLQRANEEGRADSAIEDDREALGVRGFANGGDVEKHAVRIARAFHVNKNVTARREPVGVFDLHVGESLLEVVGPEAVEEHDAGIEVGFFAKPIV